MARAMNRAGYATLARRPDPIYDVQFPLQMEAMHTLFMQIKAGTPGISTPRALVSVGHSSGFLLGAAFAQSHPNDVDALILTGYPSGRGGNRVGTPSYHYVPAVLSAPTRFPKDLNYGHLLMNNEVNRTSALYYANHYHPRNPISTTPHPDRWL
ncbi:MAG: hypothetical protein Q9166_007779 [cf. Caloplaca sp. 2 TL-2023]